MWIGTAGGLFVLEQPLGEPRFRRVEPDPSTSPHKCDRCERSPKARTARSGSARLPVFFAGFPTAGSSATARSELPRRSRRLLVDRSGRIWISHGSGLSVAIPGPAGSARSRRSSRGTAGLWRPGPMRSASPRPRRSLPIRDDRGIAGPDTEPFRGFRWPRLDRHAGRPDRVRRRAFRAYSKAHGLVNETINAVAEDSAGNVWIGADAGGVAKLTQERLRQLQRDRTGSGTIT